MPRRSSIAAALLAVLIATVLSNIANAVFAPGDFITHTQSSWGATPSGTNAASFLLYNYSTVYASNSGLLELGVPGPAGFSMLFSNGIAVNDYLPANGTMGPLTGDLFNPTVSMSGAFGGEVAVLQLNVDFSYAGVLHGNLEIPFGDLRIHGLTTYAAVNSLSVREFLAELNIKLGGSAGGLPYSITELNGIAQDINNSFAEGTLQPFANAHLRLPPFLNGDFITYPQASWGAPAGTNAASLLANNYAAVYAASGGQFEIGFPGIFGYSAQFTSAGSLLNYLPASGPAGRLLADYVNPLTTNAGGYGGEVAALKLNIDFADAGVTLGAVGLPFGDLELYDVPPLVEPGFNFNVNGMTVRELFSTANGYLGSSDFGPNPVPYLNAIAEELNRAFDAGHYSAWALDHLRIAGPYPGDFNQDGTVDAADYIIWRNGGVATTQANYNLWRTNFGRVNTFGGGSSSGATGSASANPAVPEPSGWLCVLLALWMLPARTTTRLLKLSAPPGGGQISRLVIYPRPARLSLRILNMSSHAHIAL